MGSVTLQLAQEWNGWGGEELRIRVGGEVETAQSLIYIMLHQSL